MKYLPLLLLPLLLSACFSPGRPLTPEEQKAETTRYISGIAKLAAYDGTFLYLKKHPEQRPAFDVAHASLSNLIKNSDGKLDMIDLMNVLNQLPIKQMQSSEGGSLIFGNAVIIVDTFFKNPQGVDSTQVLPIAVAIRDGIGQGLGK